MTTRKPTRLASQQLLLPGVVDQIKQDIIFGRLRPRERLIEDELSARFGVSRHVIRSAMVDLENMGLVTRRRNKGAAVRDFSPWEVNEIYEMRALLQREAAMRIPLPAERKLVRALEQIHGEYCARIQSGDLKRVCELNNAFHHTIFAAANNRYLAAMIERIWVETLGIRCYAIGDPILLARSRDEHAAMIEALRFGNRHELARLCVDHIWPALEAYKKAHGGWDEAVSAAASAKRRQWGGR